MISQTATITSKGQITIPVKIIKQAKLKKGQKLIFTLENNIIHMESATDMVKRLAGSLVLPKKYQEIDLDTLIKQAKQSHASDSYDFLKQKAACLMQPFVNDYKTLNLICFAHFRLPLSPKKIFLWK